MAMVFGMHSLTKELADVFAEDSDNDKTFHGFSESDESDENKALENGDRWDWSDDGSTEMESTSKHSQPFKLRVALRSKHFSSLSTEDEKDEDTEKPVKTKKVNKRAPKAKEEKPIKSEEKVKMEAGLSPLKGDTSDSVEEESFLAKREQNIKANKAMLAQLMADLQKMPGGAGLLKKQAGKQAKKKSSYQPQSEGHLRKNPERASRRRTRSMRGSDEPMEPQKEELELSLEEELLEVRRTPQGRGAPRNPTKPHNIRPVEDITEKELELVADNMTEKTYDKVTGSTCHQCRQKTIDTKTCCRNEACRGIQGQFCGPCLRNRYGEDVKKALLNPEWHCPPCRGICNCSFCRQREGRCPTGILFPLAQYHGFSDVHSYLTSLRNKVNKEDGEEV